jgi:hypothetical protein
MTDDIAEVGTLYADIHMVHTTPVHCNIPQLAQAMWDAETISVQEAAYS